MAASSRSAIRTDSPWPSSKSWRIAPCATGWPLPLASVPGITPGNVTANVCWPPFTIFLDDPSLKESQRDSVSKPRVARNEGTKPAKPNRNGVAAPELRLCLPRPGSCLNPSVTAKKSPVIAPSHSMTSSIMITTRNRCADLQATCRRLVALHPQPQEVLICADGCTDGSGAMVRTEFPKFHLIENDTALGSVAARHRLLTIATGDIVVSLDDDSYPADNDFFARLPDTFAAHPEAAVITFPELRNERTSAPDTGRILSVPTSSDFLPLSPRGTSGERDGERGSSTIGRPPSGHYVSAYPNCAAAMRRDVYLKTGGYPPFFFHGYEEPDYALQCYAAGYAVWFEPSLPIRHHQATANRSPFRFHQSNARNEIWSVWLMEAKGA